jgi:hypothetical protein
LLLCPVEDAQTDDITSGTKKRAARGITKMDEIFSRTPQMSKINVDLNEHGQPVGKLVGNSLVLLAATLGRRCRLLTRIGGLLRSGLN